MCCGLGRWLGGEGSQSWVCWVAASHNNSIDVSAAVHHRQQTHSGSYEFRKHLGLKIWQTQKYTPCPSSLPLKTLGSEAHLVQSPGTPTLKFFPDFRLNFHIYLVIYIQDTTKFWSCKHLSSFPPKYNTNRQCLISVINSVPATLEKRKLVKQIIPFRLLALGEARERWGH